MIKSRVRYSIQLTNLTNSSNILEYNPDYVKEGTKLGTGGFGKVIEGKYYALKFAIKKIKQYNSKSLYREIFIMKKFSHPYIPKLYGIINRMKSLLRKRGSKSSQSLEYVFGLLQRNNPSLLANGNIFNEHMLNKQKNKCSLDIILEIVEGESLDRMMLKQSLTNLEKIVILLNLATVLEYLHGNNLIHRDLKPENMMIDKKFEFKLLDFGISKIGSSGNSTKTVSVGTMCYMAPENFNLDQINETDEEGSQVFNDVTKINEMVDVWAFGCIVHEMFTGVKPWSNKVKSDAKILSLLYKKIPFEVSNLIKDPKQENLIKKCVQIDPKNRISIKEAKILLLEILFDEVNQQIVTTCTKEDNIEEKGMTSILQMFESMSKKEKFYLILKVKLYIFHYLQIMKNKKENQVKIKNEFIQKSESKEIYEMKFVDDIESTNMSKNRKTNGYNKFLIQRIKQINKDKVIKIFHLDKINDTIYKENIIEKNTSNQIEENKMRDKTNNQIEENLKGSKTDNQIEEIKNRDKDNMLINEIKNSNTNDKPTDEIKNSDKTNNQIKENKNADKNIKAIEENKILDKMSKENDLEKHGIIINKEKDLNHSRNKLTSEKEVIPQFLRSSTNKKDLKVTFKDDVKIFHLNNYEIKNNHSFQINGREIKRSLVLCNISAFNISGKHKKSKKLISKEIDFCINTDPISKNKQIVKCKVCENRDSFTNEMINKISNKKTTPVFKASNRLNLIAINKQINHENNLTINKANSSFKDTSLDEKNKTLYKSTELKSDLNENKNFKIKSFYNINTNSNIHPTSLFKPYIRNQMNYIKNKGKQSVNNEIRNKHLYQSTFSEDSYKGVFKNVILELKNTEPELFNNKKIGYNCRKIINTKLF